MRLYTSKDVETKIDVDAVIIRLSPKKRKVAELCKGGLTQAEIAKSIGISQCRVSRILQEIVTDFELCL